MKPVKLYIYPTYTPSRDKSGNLYIKYFHDAFHKDKSFNVLNRLWQLGIASLLFNIDAKVFIIQWVDLIPGKRFGKIQFILFLFLISLIDIMGKHIIWILHNKHAHKGKSKLVDYGMSFMAKKADKVFAHSKEGVTFFDTKYSRYAGKCSYVPHPVYSSTIYPSQETKYDYIIWGSIDKRKNILEFLRASKKMPYFNDKRILLCGRCASKEYDEAINKEKGVNVTYINRFISDEELIDYISKSCYILFTYNAESMLSSGALIYSLNFCKPIIGPNVGSFADEKDIVNTYNHFDEIPFLNIKFDKEACLSYLKENTWDKLPNRIMTLITE